MREIKFRAWDIFNKEMYPLSQITFKGAWHVSEGRGVSIEAQPHIPIMQFTGRVDRGGQEIYEADIVEYPVTEQNYGYSETVGYERYVIAWEEISAAFIGVSQNFIDISNLGMDDLIGCNVIGNIHSNSDLLTK